MASLRNSTRKLGPPSQLRLLRFFVSFAKGEASKRSEGCLRLSRAPPAPVGWVASQEAASYPQGLLSAKAEAFFDALSWALRRQTERLKPQEAVAFASILRRRGELDA